MHSNATTLMLQHVGFVLNIINESNEFLMFTFFQHYIGYYKLLLCFSEPFNILCWEMFNFFCTWIYIWCGIPFFIHYIAFIDWVNTRLKPTAEKMEYILKLGRLEKLHLTKEEFNFKKNRFGVFSVFSSSWAQNDFGSSILIVHAFILRKANVYIN